MQKGFALPLVLASVLLIGLIGAGGYYFYQANYPQNIPAPQPSLQPQKDETANPDSIGANWKSSSGNLEYRTSEICKVKLLTPPKDSNFYLPDGSFIDFSQFKQDGYYWIFDEGKFGMLNFLNNARVKLILANSGTDADHGSVIVYCAENTNNYDTEALFKDLQTNIAKYGKQQSINGDVTITKIAEMTKWGRKIFKVSLSNIIYASGDYYLLASDKKNYLITGLPISNNTNRPEYIIKTLEEVMNNIQFLE